MTKNYGTVQYKGNTYILLEDAYPDRVGPCAYPAYCTQAIRKGEEPDYFGFVPVFQVTWYVLDKYMEFDYDLFRFRMTADEDVEEYDLCDWSDPADVHLIGQTLWEEVREYAERQLRRCRPC